MRPLRYFALCLLALVLCAPAQARRAGPEAAPSTSCAELTRDFPGTPCSFDFPKFRMRDPVLDAIEGKGLSGSGLFGGRTLVVRTLAELNEARGDLKPGDELVLGDGTWRDARIRIEARGTAERPILIRAETPGRTVLSGGSALTVFGAHVVVHGLHFLDGRSEDDSFVVLRLGAGKGQPCDFCLADRIVIDGYNSDPSRYTTAGVVYMQLQGRDITVANSKLLGKRNAGPAIHYNHPIDRQCPAAIIAAKTCFQRFLFTGNTVSGVSKGVRQKSRRGFKVKVMELGDGHRPNASSFSVIENNVFENADGGTNTLSLKTSDVIIRNNVFRDNLGTVNLRASNRVLVENNLFDGTNRPGMGGVLIQGAGHWIVNNRFRNLIDPLNDYHMPLAMPAALDEDLKDGGRDYARVKDTVIAGNVFENVSFPALKMGIYAKPAIGRSKMPSRVYLLGNRFSFARGRAPKEGELIEYVGGPDPKSVITVAGNRIAE